MSSSRPDRRPARDPEAADPAAAGKEKPSLRAIPLFSDTSLMGLAASSLDHQTGRRDRGRDALRRIRSRLG